MTPNIPPSMDGISELRSCSFKDLVDIHNLKLLCRVYTWSDTLFGPKHPLSVRIALIIHEAASLLDIISSKTNYGDTLLDSPGIHDVFAVAAWNLSGHTSDEIAKDFAEAYKKSYEENEAGAHKKFKMSGIPCRVNTWENFGGDIVFEVWFNGKDGYSIYKNKQWVDTVYFSCEETMMSAVETACAMALTMCKRCYE